MAEDSVEKREKKFSQVFAMDYTGDREGAPSQDYYEAIKSRFAEERHLRLGYRPPGTEIYQALEGELERFEHDPREAVVDHGRAAFPALKQCHRPAP